MFLKLEAHMRKTFLFLAGVIILALLELIYLNYKLADKIHHFEQAQILQAKEMQHLDTYLTRISKSLPQKSLRPKGLDLHFTNRSTLIKNTDTSLYLFAAVSSFDSPDKNQLP